MEIVAEVPRGETFSWGQNEHPVSDATSCIRIFLPRCLKTVRKHKGNY